MGLSQLLAGDAVRTGGFEAVMAAPSTPQLDAEAGLRQASQRALQSFGARQHR